MEWRSGDQCPHTVAMSRCFSVVFPAVHVGQQAMGILHVEASGSEGTCWLGKWVTIDKAALTSAAVRAWLITTGLGVPVVPLVCKTRYGSYLACSKVLSYG